MVDIEIFILIPDADTYLCLLVSSRLYLPRPLLYLECTALSEAGQTGKLNHPGISPFLLRPPASHTLEILFRSVIQPHHHHSPSH